MLKQIFALTWKDLKIFFKDRGHVVLIFLQPLMFIVLMSYALSGVFHSSEEAGENIRAAAVSQDDPGKEQVLPSYKKHMVKSILHLCCGCDTIGT